MEFIFPLIELVAALFAAVNYHKYKNSNERYFLFLLWFVFLVEATNLLLKKVFAIEINWLHHIFGVVSFPFYFYWYYSILKSAIFKRVTLIFALSFLIMTGLAIIFSSTLGGKAYAFVIGSVGLLVSTVFHYHQLLNSDEVLVVKYKLSFWISTALFLFYMGIVPLMLLSDYMGIEDLSYFIVLVALNAILYGCFIIGFIWTKREYNRF